MAGIRRVSDLGTKGWSNILDGSIVTADLANNSVTQAKLDTAVPLSGMRNMIINGNIGIDQRNSGSLVTINSTSNFYGPDRWQAFGQLTDGTFTIQQVSSNPTPPSGFKNALKISTANADASIGSTQTYGVTYKIEGSDVAKLSWGTSGAKQAILSFWVYGSKVGTYGGSVSNSSFDRSYPFTYTINSINTWEYKTVSIVGDTSGTWLTDNGIGIRIEFSIGAGTNQIGTPGVWAATRYDGATGQVNLINTPDSLTLTGVQFEQGPQATQFEQRSFATELSLCQRYYWRWNTGGVTEAAIGIGYSSSGVGRILVPLPVQMRACTSGSLEVSNNSHFGIVLYDAVNVYTPSLINYYYGGPNVALINVYNGSLSANWTISFRSTSSSAYLGFFAEL